MDPNNPYTQFQAAINARNGVTGGAAPVSDPNAVAKNFAIAKTGADFDPAQFAGGTAVVQAKNDDIVAANNAQAAKEAAQRSQDAADPSKAQQVLLPNGQGYAFYDGTGKQLNINQYSLLVGKTPAELLADSPNPKDQKFVADYNALQKFTNAWVNGDTKTLATLRAQDPQKFNQIISTYKTPADMVNAFTQHWSDYYGNTNGAQQQNTASAALESNNTPKLDPNNPIDANLAKTNLSQILTPDNIPTSAPSENLFEKLNPFSSQHKAVNAYKAKVAADPWAAYTNSLYGG